MNRRELMVTGPLLAMAGLGVKGQTLQEELSRWLPADGFGMGRWCPACETELNRLLRRKELALMTGRDIWPATVFLDGHEIRDVVHLIASAQCDHPVEGAAFQLFRPLRRQGDHVAGKWLYGRISWQPRRQDQ